MISMIVKLLSALHSESSPWQVAVAFSLALVVGLTPFLSLHNVLILFFVCILRINFGAFVLGVLLFSGLSGLIDPMSIRLGEHVLAQPTLVPWYTEWYQSEFARVTAFNNTLVIGGLVVSLLAFVPVLLLSRWLIVQYRQRFLAWLNRFKIVQVLKASKFFAALQRFGG